MTFRIWTRDDEPSTGALSPRSCTRLPISNRKLPELEASLSGWKQTTGYRSNRKFSRVSQIASWQASRKLYARVVRSVAVVALVLASGVAPALAKPHPSKSLTVERIYGGPSLSGHLIQGIEWSPDGKRISYLQRDGSSVEMWTMDAAKGDRKVLVKASVLEEVMQPRKTSAIQSTGLGRVAADNYIWSPSGDALLFIGSSNLMYLDLKNDDIEAPCGCRGQCRAGRRRPKIFARRQMGQLRA